MKLTEVKKETPPIRVDLDGVLFDFVGGVNKMYKELGIDKTHDESKYGSDSKYRNEMWDTIARYQKETGKGFWEELPLMSDAHALWNYISKFPHEVLTATGDPKFGAGEQKKRAVKKHFGDANVILVRKASDKAQYAVPDGILIDDQKKAIDPWNKKGIGILHKNAADTISKLKKQGY